MKLREILALTCVTMLGTVAAIAGDLIDFDPQAPPLPAPGAKYRLVLHPGKDAKPVTFILTAGTEVYGEHEGKPWTNIEKLEQADSGELPFENQGGVPYTDIIDYDRDGYLDFRIVAGWGSGGTWYNYYRYDGQRYLAWDEATELNISHIEPEKASASSHGRSGPAWSATYFDMKGSHFHLRETEVFDQAQYLRKIVPKEIPDDTFILVTETIREGRIKKRKIVFLHPGQDETEAKPLLDQEVDEEIKPRSPE